MAKKGWEVPGWIDEDGILHLGSESGEFNEPVEIELTPKDKPKYSGVGTRCWLIPKDIKNNPI